MSLATHWQKELLSTMIKPTLILTSSAFYLSDTRMWYCGREQSDSYHPQTPQTALPETTLMSYRWSLIKPLAKGRILIGVICIS